MERDSIYKVRVFGYCLDDNEKLLNKFLSNGPKSLLGLPGDYVIVIENKDETFLISSTYAVNQYYYAVDNGRFYHSDTVMAILKMGAIKWEWNWQALADFARMGQVLENDTLHKKVFRVPASSILHFKGGKLDVRTVDWNDLYPKTDSTPEIALKAFNREVEYWVKEDSIVSISAGFDSRTILSSVLKTGCRPLLLATGSDKSTEVQISKSIAKSLGLNIQQVILDINDYLEYGEQITLLTNATKPACDWHTFIYPKKANLDSQRTFFVGTNGEFVRSAYLNKGIVARIADIIPSLSLPYFWKRKLKPKFTEDEINGMNPEFAVDFSGQRQKERLSRLMNLCHNQMLPGLDRFFLEQRIRSFHGNGLKMNNASLQTRLPYLSKDWVVACWNLNRGWKLGENSHRYAIIENYPKLLNFPEAKTGNIMAPKAAAFYWTKAKRIKGLVPYADYDNWFRGDLITSFILDNASVLSELISKETVYKIVEDHKNHNNRLSVIAFMLPMIYWLKNTKYI